MTRTFLLSTVLAFGTAQGAFAAAHAVDPATLTCGDLAAMEAGAQMKAVEAVSMASHSDDMMAEGEEMMESEEMADGEEMMAEGEEMADGDDMMADDGMMMDDVMAACDGKADMMVMDVMMTDMN